MGLITGKVIGTCPNWTGSPLMAARRTFSLSGLTNLPSNMMMLPLSAKTVLLSRISTWLMAVFIAGSGVGASRKEEA